MEIKTSPSGNSRRAFLSNVIPAVAVSCFGCKPLIADCWQDNPGSDLQQEFLVDSNMNYQQVFNFAFKSWYIRYMKGLAEEIGKEKFLEILKNTGWKLYQESIKKSFGHLKKRDVESLIANFWAPMQKSRLWSHCLPVEIIKQTSTEGLVKMSRCLVAKVFRDNDAADIGYAGICHADFAVADAFNPKIKLVRNNCLMKGDNHCLFEYTLKT
jgi:hypothetical protein